jgi:hypothetical protein
VHDHDSYARMHTLSLGGHTGVHCQHLSGGCYLTTRSDCDAAPPKGLPEGAGDWHHYIQDSDGRVRVDFSVTLECCPAGASGTGANMVCAGVEWANCPAGGAISVQFVTATVSDQLEDATCADHYWFYNQGLGEGTHDNGLALYKTKDRTGHSCTESNARSHELVGVLGSVSPIFICVRTSTWCMFNVFYPCCWRARCVHEAWWCVLHHPTSAGTI